MARKTITSILLLTVAFLASAQTLEDFKDNLSTPSESGSSVTITESYSAQSALRRIAATPKKSGFLGYRIGIFFDNSPTARAKADAAKELFESRFPAEEVYMVYENPYFKVSAGNCVTQEEAVILLDRIQRVFPKAYIMREQLAIKDIIIREKPDSLLIPTNDTLVWD
ncbi:MAG: hypothetical protein SNI57_05865 [Rikenellaceae bacterium]